MTAQHLEPRPEPTRDRSANPPTTATDPRTATARAPKVFSTTSRDRLANLVDEWNAAVVADRNAR